MEEEEGEETEISPQIDQFGDVATDSPTAPSANLLININEPRRSPRQEPSKISTPCIFLKIEEPDSSPHIPQQKTEKSNPRTKNIPENPYKETIQQPPLLNENKNSTNNVKNSKIKISDSKLNLLKDSLLAGESIYSVDPAYLQPLIKVLKEDRDYKIGHRQVDDAEKCDQILFSARQRYNDIMKSTAMENRMNDIRARLANARDDLADVKRNFQHERIDLEEAQKTQLLNLEYRQRQDLEEMRELWRSPRCQRMFNKPSPMLRSMQFQAKLLLNDRRFNEQRKTDQNAKARAELELSENARRMNTEYANALRMFERKQKSELNVLLQSQAEKVEELNLREQNAILQQEKRIFNLSKEYEVVCDPTKVWNLYHRNERPKGNKNEKGTAKPKPNLSDYITLKLPPLESPRRRIRTANPQRA